MSDRLNIFKLQFIYFGGDLSIKGYFNKHRKYYQQIIQNLFLSLMEFETILNIKPKVSGYRSRKSCTATSVSQFHIYQHNFLTKYLRPKWLVSELAQSNPFKMFKPSRAYVITPYEHLSAWCARQHLARNPARSFYFSLSTVPIFRLDFSQ